MRRIRNREWRQPEMERRGAAMVEFAVIAPLFLTMILGTIELGMGLRASTTLINAVRGGGRLAGMDWSELVEDGQTANQKIVEDIRSFITASGLNGDATTITITSAEEEDFGQPIDLEDPDNDLRLLQIEVEIPYSAIATFPSQFLSGISLRETLVIRAGRSTISG